MSIQAVAWAIDQKTGSAAGKVVLICLANYADEDGQCWPSQKTIAEETELSERSVREWLQKLEDAGLLTRKSRRRDDGYRAADLICLALKNQPAKSAGKSDLTGKSRQSHRQIAPTLPEPVAAPTSFEPSVEPSAAARGKFDLDAIREKLLEAVGEGNIQPHGCIDMSSILGLLTAGVDLETDIIPTLKARSARIRSPVREWSYFTDAIRDAYNRRIEAGQGLSKPKVSTIKPDAEMTPDELRAAWVKRLKFGRYYREWMPFWGAMPGQEGCTCPPDLLEPKDGQHPDGTPWSVRRIEAA